MLFHGPSPHHVSLWDNFGGLLRPSGKTYTPLRGMISLSLIASSNVVIHKFLRNSRSALQPVEVAAMHCRCVFLRGFSLILRLA